MGIPLSFFVGGQKISDEMVNHLDGSLGRCCVGAGWLRIAGVFKEEHQSESSKENSDYPILGEEPKNVLMEYFKGN